MSLPFGFWQSCPLEVLLHTEHVWPVLYVFPFWLLEPGKLKKLQLKVTKKLLKVTKQNTE